MERHTFPNAKVTVNVCRVCVCVCVIQIDSSDLCPLSLFYETKELKYMQVRSPYRMAILLYRVDLGLESNPTTTTANIPFFSRKLDERNKKCDNGHILLVSPCKYCCVHTSYSFAARINAPNMFHATLR